MANIEDCDSASNLFGQWLSKDLKLSPSEFKMFFSQFECVFKKQVGLRSHSTAAHILLIVQLSISGSAVLEKKEPQKIILKHSDRSYPLIGFPMSQTLVGFMWANFVLHDIELRQKEFELQKKKRELQASETKFQRFYNSNVLGIFVCNHQGKILEANDKFLEILGFDRKDLDNGDLNWIELTPPEWLETDMNIQDKNLQQGFCPLYEKEFYNKQHERVPVETAGAVSDFSKANGNDLTNIFYIVDLRTRKQFEQELMKTREEAIRAREEAVEASQAKSNFLSTMSHELRTPLAGIIGSQSLLMETALDREQKDYVDFTIRSSQGLLSLLGDVLDLSKIEAGKVILQMSKFDLKQAVEDSVLVVGELANKKGLELVTYFHPSLQELTLSSAANQTVSVLDKAKSPINVIFDMTRLRQIIINLVGNAIKFTSQNGVLIKLSLLKKNQRLRNPDDEASVGSEDRTQTIVNETHEECEDFTASPSIVSMMSFVNCSSEELPVVACKDPDDVRRVLVEVKDTGEGIELSKQKMLFKKFSQVDGNANRRFEGAGLGLSICKLLVGLMGGSIGVSSEKGHGSVFYFDVPVIVPEPEPAEESVISMAAIKQQVPRTTDREKQSMGQTDVVQSLKCAVISHGKLNLCSTKVFLVKNNIAFDRLSLDENDPVQAIESHQFDLLILCLHHNHDLEFQAIERLGKAAASSSMIANFPLVLAGTRESLASRHVIPYSANLRNVTTISKPCCEAILLEALYLAYTKANLKSAPPVELAAEGLTHVEAEVSEGDAAKYSLPSGQAVDLSLLPPVSTSNRDENAAGLPEITTSPQTCPFGEFSSNSVLELARVSTHLMEKSDAAAVHQSSALKEQGASRIMHMLLAEDNTMMQKIARKQFETKLKDFDLVIVGNGLEAVSAASKFMEEHNTTFSVIWMDVMMPVMDGTEATREIRRIEQNRGFTTPETQSYIVALTADVNKETSNACFASGVNNYVPKPMNSNTLVSVLEAAMQVRGLKN